MLLRPEQIEILHKIVYDYYESHASNTTIPKVEREHITQLYKKIDEFRERFYQLGGKDR